MERDIAIMWKKNISSTIRIKCKLILSQLYYVNGFVTEGHLWLICEYGKNFIIAKKVKLFYLDLQGAYSWKSSGLGHHTYNLHL